MQHALCNNKYRYTIPEMHNQLGILADWLVKYDACFPPNRKKMARCARRVIVPSPVRRFEVLLRTPK